MKTKNIKIKFSYENFALFHSVSPYLIKEVKSITEFKKWFKTHHFKSSIIDAWRVFPNNLEIKIEELKNFNTFEK